MISASATYGTSDGHTTLIFGPVTLASIDDAITFSARLIGNGVSVTSR